MKKNDLVVELNEKSDDGKRNRRFTFWGPSTCTCIVPDVMTIQPVVVELFQSGAKWWTI